MQIRFLESNHNFSFEEIKKMQFFEDEHTGKVLSFAHDYLSQKQSFELQTSGSTGKPKKIQVSRNQIQSSVRGTAQILGLQASQKALLCLNPETVGAKMMIARALQIQMELLVVSPSANPLKNIQENFDFAAFVPLQMQHILEQSPEKKEFLDKAQNIILGGAAVSDSLIEQIQNLKSNIFQTYGMTETLSHIALRRLNPLEKFYKLLPQIQIRQDQRGCLEICAEVSNREWITTNDLVEIIDNEHFSFLGRIDNVINSGGVKIQAEELEAKISSIFASENINFRIAILSQTHQLLGEQVVLVVESQEIDEQILEKCFYQLEKYHKPRKVLLLPYFPETKSQKIDKIQLKKILFSDKDNFAGTPQSIDTHL